MSLRPACRLIGLLLVPALLVSGAAQGLLLYRCSEGMVRLSCCCAGMHKAPAEPPASIKTECCDKLAVPPADTREAPRAAPGIPPPMQSFVTAEAPAVPAPVAPSVRLCRHASDPPPRPSPVVSNCSRLI